jgi:hypothetical protein
MTFVFFAACAVCAAKGVPGVDITVKSGGKTVKQVKTDASGNFAVGTLPEGPYTLEMRAKNSPELKNKQVSITVKGTKQSGSLEHVKGEQLIAGAALKVEVARGANVTGQIGVGAKMVWIPPMLGSNRPGHWVEEDSAEAKTSKSRGSMSNQSVQKMQESASNPAGN